MSIAKSLCLALSAGLIATSVAADETSPFLGNWSGVGPNGQHNELNVVAVESDGQITAVYRAERPNGFGFWFDIEPGGIESSVKRRGRALHFARTEDKMRYRFILSGDDALTFRYTRKGKHSTRTTESRGTPRCRPGSSSRWPEDGAMARAA